MDENSGRAKGRKRLGEMHYRNSWYFANSSLNPCDVVWETGEAYRTNKKKKRFEYPVELTRYFYLLYLTGSRLNEPMLGDLEINLVNKSNEVYITLSKVNEKHFQKRVLLEPGKDPGFDRSGRKKRPKLDLQKSKRDIIYMSIPILCDAEYKMWNLITSAGTQSNVKEMFKFDRWGVLYDARLSRYIRRNFKTDLYDEAGIVHQKAGVTPHILRHMRAYNVLITHGIPDKIAMAWFGWNDQHMLYYYAHIRKMLKYESQLEMLREKNKISDKYRFVPQTIDGTYTFNKA